MVIPTNVVFLLRVYKQHLTNVKSTSYFKKDYHTKWKGKMSSSGHTQLYNHYLTIKYTHKCWYFQVPLNQIKRRDVGYVTTILSTYFCLTFYKFRCTHNFFTIFFHCNKILKIHFKSIDITENKQLIANTYFTNHIYRTYYIYKSLAFIFYTLYIFCNNKYLCIQIGIHQT